MNRFFLTLQAQLAAFSSSPLSLTARLRCLGCFKLCLAAMTLAMVSADAGESRKLSRAEAAAATPNIVLIISDDQRWTDYGFMGHAEIRTPHLDRLSTESALFTRGYVPDSLCRPSLMTMITGLYPHQHKIVGNDPPRGTDRNLLLKHIRAANTIPDRLAPLGYLSHQSGKWWEGNHSEGGFTHGMTHGDVTRRGRHGDEGLAIGRKGLEPITQFIDQCDGKPFFLWYAPFLPHTPHTPPERLLKKYQRDGRDEKLAKYYAMCEWFDETCGELLAAIDQRGMTDNTIVLYVTDNGWIQKTRDSELPEGYRQPFAPRSKRAPHEGGVRTPIMVKWPGRVEPGLRRTLVSSIDLLPTILDATEQPRDESLPGLSLLDLAEEDGPNTIRDTIFGEILEHDIVDIDDPADSLMYRWCIRDEWKLIVPTDRVPGDSVELYDLAEDPFETMNLADKRPILVEQLTGALNDWWAAK